MFIIQYRKIFFFITALLIAGSIGAIFFLGLPFGIDFKGGSLIEVSYTDQVPEKAIIEDVIGNLGLGEFSFRTAGESSYILRIRDITDSEHTDVLNALSLQNTYSFTEDRFTSIGPVIGSELKDKAVVALIVVLIVIILYVAFAFRGVSKPVSSWKYGSVAIIALAHDILVPSGAFALYAYYTGAEIDTLFVMALLAILGYSVNDTIVIFDRVREHLLQNKRTHTKETFASIIGHALQETYARSINTSITTFFVLTTLFVVGGAVTKDFAFTLLVGVLAGTYSSIFLAAPLLVSLSGKELQS